MGSPTLLTPDLSQQEIDSNQKAKDEHQRHIDIISIFCQSYVDSLEGDSYSYSNTIGALCSIITTCIDKEILTQSSGDRFLAHYMLKCHPFSDHKGKGKIQVPHALVKIVKEGNWWLRKYHGCKTAENSNGDPITYKYQYEKLSYYGVPISESQIKKWEYRK